jgi:hypothetical protein
MSATTFEAFLARLYVDESARSKFLADPHGEASKAGLTAQEVEAAANIDRVGLQMFSQSLDHKRRKRRNSMR